MRLTERQKNIVNPYPESYETPAGTPGRRGKDYNYENERNKWVIEGIHDCFLNYGYFPSVGTILKNIGPIRGEVTLQPTPDNIVSSTDILAYAALYPQNAIVKGSPFATENDYNPGPNPLQLDMISDAEGWNILSEIARKLFDNEQLEKFTCINTPESQLREYELLHSTLRNLDWRQPGSESLDLVLSMYPAIMGAIPYTSTQSRIISIRESFGNNPTGPLLKPPLNSLSLRQSLIENQKSGVDLTDWTKNIGPDANVSNMSYFNPNDSNLYFLRRTKERSSLAFDLDTLADEDSSQYQTLLQFKREALRGMLELAGRTSTDEEQFNTALRLVYVDTYYGDSYRPPVPAGLGFWILGAKATIALIDEFPEKLEPVNTQAFYKSPPSPYSLAKNVIKNANASFSFSYTYKHLRTKINDINQVLRFYINQFEEEQLPADVLVGFNIENEIQLLEQFPEKIQFLMGQIQQEYEDDDFVEFKLDKDFQPLYYGRNGNLYFKGIGVDVESLMPARGKYTRSNSPDSFSGENMLQNITPTTFSYIVNAPKIQTFAQTLATSEPPPWTEFFSNYTYPNPNKNSWYPSQISSWANKTFELKPDPKTTRKQAAAVKRSKIIKTPEELRKINEALLAKRKAAVSKKQVYLLVRNSIGGCNSGFAQSAKLGLELYKLLNSKSRPQDWVNLTVATLRTELVSEVIAHNLRDAGADVSGEEFRDGLTKAEFYNRNPDQLVRMAEKYIDDQLDVCLGAIGKVIIQQVIRPGENPKYATKYWKKRIGKTQKVKIRKGFTRDRNRLWLKALKKSLIKFVEQLIVSVLADVVQAALGCGPSTKNDEEPKKFSRNPGAYGQIQIGELASTQLGAAKILELAEQYEIVNYTPTIDEEGNKSVATSPATFEQLVQFMKDTSDYLIAEEAAALLDNNASPKTIASIYEMIYNGTYSLPPDDEIDERLSDDELYLRQFQNSLRVDDVLYASLEINHNNIIGFYGKIGELIDPDLDAIPPLDPAEAWCAQKNPHDIGDLTELGLSSAQAIKQLDQQIQAKVGKIKEKCDFISLNWNLDAEINAFFSAQGLGSAWDAFLADIAEQSKALQKAIRESLLGSSQSAATVPQRITEEDMALYIFADEIYGDRLTRPQVRVKNNTAPEWFIGDSDIGEVSFIMTSDKVSLYHRSLEDFREGSPSRLIGENSLTSDNITTVDPPQDTNIDYPPEGVGEFSLIDLASETGTSPPGGYSQGGDIIQYPSMTDSMAEKINNLILWGQGVANLAPAETYNYENQFMLLISNMGDEGLIKEQLKDFYLTDTATRNLRKFVEIIYEPFFEHTGDLCNPTRSERVATAAMAGIQSRLINFLLNTGPLTRVYFFWNTPDILNTIVEYLSTKIQRDLTDKGLINVYLETMNDITDTFSREDTPENETPFDLRPIVDIREKLKYIIHQSFKEFFRRYTKSRSLKSPIERNLYYANQRKWVHLMKWFKEGAFNYDAFQIPSLSPPLNSEPSINAIDDLGWIMIAGQYYIPAPLIIAMQIVYYDKVIGIGNRFPAFRLEHRRRIAIVDDALLSTINDAHYSIFQQPYEGYPLSVEGTTYYSEEEVLAEISFLRDQRNRLYALEAMFGPLAIYDEDYMSRAYLYKYDDDGLPVYLPKVLTENDPDDPNFRDFFNPIYERARPGYERLYGNASSRKGVQRTGVAKWWLTTYPEDFSDPVQNVRDLTWMNQRAWYERARLLGAAGTPLIDSYVKCNDLDNNPRYNTLEDNGDRVIDSVLNPGDDEDDQITRRDYISTTRLNLINESSFNPSENVRTETRQVLEAVGYGVLAAAPVVAVQAAGAALIAAIGTIVGGTFSIAVWPLVAVGVIVTAVGGLIAWWAGRDDYYDPNEDTCVNRIPLVSPTVPITDEEIQGNYDPYTILASHTEEVFGPADDFIEAAAVLDGHSTTMDKAAMNALYYELAVKSVQLKPRFDPKIDNNELDQLLEAIDAEEEPETVFPVYIELESVDTPHLKMRAFNTIEDVQNAIMDLQESPIYAVSDEWRRRQQALDDNRAESERLLAVAEQEYGRFLQLIRNDPNDEYGIVLQGRARASDSVLDGMRRVLYGSLVPPPTLSFRSFIDEYRYVSGAGEYRDILGMGYGARRIDEWDDIWGVIGQSGHRFGDVVSPDAVNNPRLAWADDPGERTLAALKQIGYVLAGTRRPRANQDSHGQQPPGVTSSLEHMGQIQRIYDNLPEDIDLEEENYQQRLDKIDRDIIQIQNVLQLIQNEA